MKTFNDAAGRTWTISLTLGTAMAVKSKLGVDLLQPEAPRNGDTSGGGGKGTPLLTLLGTDEMLLGEVLCALLESQFEAHKVTADDVRNAFDGRALLAAQKAFYEELIDFFQLRGRTDRAKAVAKQMTLIDAAIAAIETRIDEINVEQTIAQALPGAGVMSGAWPEPSASTPNP